MLINFSLRKSQALPEATQNHPLSVSGMFWKRKMRDNVRSCDYLNDVKNDPNSKES